ncbi:MAG: hypothetical protein H8D94_00710 [Candidatus Pelagibacter sp.]|nr:hypothetical protein [Candidatus Pelagibacter sp.]
MVSSLLRSIVAILVVGISLYISSMFVGFSVGMFFDIGSLFIVLIPTLSLSMGSSSKESMFSNMVNNSIRFGWIGFIINLVTMSFSIGQVRIPMENIPGIFGLQFGIGSISLLYGYLFGYLLFEPLRRYNINK